MPENEAKPSEPTEKQPDKPQSPQKKMRPPPVIPGLWIWLFIAAAITAMLYFGQGFGSRTHITYDLFKKQLKADNIEKVVFTQTKMTGKFKSSDKLPEELQETFKENELRFSSKPVNVGFDPQLNPQLDEMGVEYEYTRDFLESLGPVLLLMLPMLFLIGIFVIFILPRLRDPLGGGFLSSYIKSPAKRYEKNKSRISFEEVADMENAKGELQEVVEFLRSPEKFQKLGGQIPKGVLLIGPPGTGKTLLARAVAGEAGVPFFSMSGSEFIQMFVGVGASRVRDLFKTAKDNAPCILFIDEIDAVGRVRGAGLGGGHDEREQTLNQILSEMDGFQPTETVIVIAATNRPDVLDPALLRPGRFDRHVTIDRPTWQGRLAILKVHTKDKPIDENTHLESIARAMIGMTGADLRNLANEAALLATRKGKEKIDRRDFEQAADRVLIGATREEVLTPEDKKRTAYHEAGHALVCWYEPASDRPLKVSIVPRGQTLGVNLSIPEEERYHHGLEHYQARIVVLMGGRAADRLIYGQAYSGAESDLKQATRIARMMVTHWGMSDRIGPVTYRVGEEHVFLGKEIQEQKDFSEGTAHLIDEEVRRILQEADERAYSHLNSHREELDRIVDALLQREELSREEIDSLITNGELPPGSGEPKEEFVLSVKAVPGGNGKPDEDGDDQPAATSTQSSNNAST